ncbi:MAG: putative membrane protein [Psychrosphaera sp.]|jgi:uncharacterized membrane protein
MESCGMNLSVSVNINSCIDQVWRAITDIHNCDKMINGIIGLTILEQPESGLVGLKWQETRLMFGKDAVETMWITECQEQAYYCTRAENHGAIYITKMSVQSIDDQTVLTMTFSGTSDSFWIKVLSSVMSLFIKKSMMKMLQADLEDIKRYVESQSN